jgi:hypothetical protein
MSNEDAEVLSRLRLQLGLDDDADSETVERHAAAHLVQYGPGARAQWLSNQLGFFGEDSSPRQKAEGMKIYRSLRNVHENLRKIGR